MIRNIFLPEQIKNQYLFSQKYLGLEITKSTCTATKLQVAGKQAIIHDFYQEPIIKKEIEDGQENTSTAIKQLIEKAGNNYKIRLALPNNIAIFKELTLPFLEREKIQQILAFELESQIPFAIKDVLFDFIITQQDSVQKTSTILVGIVAQKDIDYYTNILGQAGAKLDIITLDLFALYGLYAAHPRYNTMTGAIALIDVGLSYTTIAYISKQQLLSVRTINIGLGTIAKNIAEKTKENAAQVIEFIIRFGLTPTDNPTFNKALENELAQFCQHIQLTVETFVAQSVQHQPIQQAIIISRGTTIKELDLCISKALNTPVEFFDTNLLLTRTDLALKHGLSKIPIVNVISLGAAYPFSITSQFNLLSMQKTPHEVMLLQKQLIAGLVTLLLFVAIMIGYSYMQYSSAVRHITYAKKTALNLLNNEFGITDRNLNNAVENAQQKIEKSEQIWAGLSGQSRPSFLKYLQELSTQLDRDSLGLELKQLRMDWNEKTITLNGQVRDKDFTALAHLIKALQESKLFSLVSEPEQTKFDIKLKIKNENEGPA